MARVSPDPWQQIEALTNQTVPDEVRAACVAPKLVKIPAGRLLYAAGTVAKESMQWGAFEELDVGWYLQGNQLDPAWYRNAERIAIYEYEVVLTEETPAIMSKVADQPNAPPRVGPAKYQFYSPAGLGRPVRKRLLGYLERDGSFRTVGAYRGFNGVASVGLGTNSRLLPAANALIHSKGDKYGGR
jgi:hypothetical protein